MKKSKTKRILALVLSILMIVTSVPVVAFTAFGADEGAVDEVKAAMTAFESKMDGTTVYTNMSAAYTAYVDCQKALDAYNYGAVSNALSGKAAALNSAVSNMNTWENFSVTSAEFTIGSTTATNENVANLIYANSTKSTRNDFGTGVEIVNGGALKYGCAMHPYYADTVLLYNGVTTPSFPVALGLVDSGKRYDVYYQYAYPTTAGLELRDYWKGYQDAINWPITATNGNVGYGNNNRTTSKVVIGNTSTKRSFANVMYYTGTPTATLTTISSTDWNGMIDHNSQTGSMTYGDNAIYVLNVVPLQNAIKNAMAKLDAVENYKQGGMAAVFTAVDNAMNINVNSYGYENGVAAGAASCQAAIDSALSAVNNAQPQADQTGYQAVRDAMTTQVINTYNNGTNGWTTETWNAFKTAFDAARAMMVAPYNGGSYSATNGDAVAAELTAAFEGLRSNVKYADTTALTNVIAQFRAFEGIFTDDSYQAALAVIANAIDKVWGGEEYFGIVTRGPEDTEDGNALVAEQTKAVENAIKALRIDADTTVMTAAGRFSLNQVIAYNVSNPEAYYNYVDFATAVDVAKQYRSLMATTDLTDYDAQYAAYQAEVQKVLDAFFSLEYALTMIPDNTVYNNDSVVTMKTMSAEDHGAQSITPTYTNKAVIIKTTHTPSTVAFGKFNIDFMTNVTNSEGGSDNYKARNIGIDSISIHATAPAVEGNFITTTSGLGDKLTPPNLSDADKATYAGQLSYNAFSVSNLKYTGKTSNSDPRTFISLADGTRITDENEALNYNLDTVLGTTDASSTNNLVTGVVFNHSTGGDAHIYIEGDFNASVTPQNEATLTRNTVPKRSPLNLSNTNFGAVTNHACRNTQYYSQRCWFTSASNNEGMVAQVEVVDISYLLDLVKLCDAMSNDASKYTEESFAAFADALKAAKANYPYTEKTAQQFTTEATTRYRNLWDAKEALKHKDIAVTFNYKNADGTDASTVISVEWGATLESIKDQIEAIVTPDYSADGLSHTFIGWTGLNYATEVLADMSFSASYDSYSSVDWTVYNAAQDMLINNLTNGIYFASGLDEIKLDTDALKYFAMPESEKIRVTADNQDAINAEAEVLAAINEKLAEFAADPSTYDALIKTVETLNADAYDVATVQAAMSETTASREVTIGGVSYTGWDYDFFISAVMTAMNGAAYEYTVTVMDADANEYFLMKDGSYTDDPDAADVFHYGDLVTVVNPVDETQECTWTVSIIAQLTSTSTTNKYVGTASSYQFNVRGETTIETSATEAPEDYHTVTFVDGRNNTMIASITVADNKNLTAKTRRDLLPKVPFYEVSSFTDRNTGTVYKESDIIRNIKSDMILTVNYTPVETVTGYTIILLDASGNEIAHQNANWNQKVTLTATGAAGMVDTATGKVVAYGSEYTFYACQSMTLQATDTVDGKVAVSVAMPVVSNGRVYFTGSFAKQGHVPNNDKTVKGYGIVIDVYGNNKDLTLKDIDSTVGVFNLAASAETVGSQFTLYTAAPSGRSVTYRAYVIYEQDGAELIEYSDVIDTVIE